MNIAIVGRVTRRTASCLVLALLAAALSLTLLAQAPNLRPGQYEDTEETSIPGRPGKMARKYLRCYTAEDLKDWNNLFKEDDSRRRCKIVDRKATGTTLMLTKQCAAGDGTLTATIDVTVTSPDSYQAVVNMKQSSGRATNPMLQGSTTTATAKRIGECAK